MAAAPGAHSHIPSLPRTLQTRETRKPEGSSKHLRGRRRGTGVEFGLFIWALWEKGRAWAGREALEVMSCEGGIPHAKNNRRQSDVYRELDFNVCIDSMQVWHTGQCTAEGRFMLQPDTNQEFLLFLSLSHLFFCLDSDVLWAKSK